MIRQELWRVVGALFAAIPGVACASYSSVRFAPPIQDVELHEGTSPEARMTVAWRGIRTRDEAHELRFRIRVESLAAESFALAAPDFELLDGALASFGAARAEALPLTVEAGGEATFDLAFPVPAGRKLRDYDLSALNLRALFQQRRWSSNTTFQRVEVQPYYDPYWNSPWRFHVGVFWCR